MIDLSEGDVPNQTLSIHIREAREIIRDGRGERVQRERGRRRPEVFKKILKASFNIRLGRERVTQVVRDGGYPVLVTPNFDRVLKK